MTTSFENDGYYLTDHYLTAAECRRVVDLISEYRKHHSITAVQRLYEDRPLNYSVIDGDEVNRYLPDVLKIYGEMTNVVSKIAGLELVPLSDRKVSCNINITGRDGSYRWHYDRNAVTAILYLNEVAGGETECYPNYRLILGRSKFAKLQRSLDFVLRNRVIRKVLGKLLIVPPQAGRLLVMRGDRCLHSVRPVEGSTDRLAVIMSYDVPGAEYDAAEGLNKYLYSQNSVAASDPNYR